MAEFRPEVGLVDEKDGSLTDLLTGKSPILSANGSTAAKTNGTKDGASQAGEQAE